MKYGIYAIRDSKTGFLPLNVDLNDASAMRNFEHAAMQESSLFFSHRADYDLCRLGSYDTDTGEIELFPLTVVCSGSSLKEVK